MKRLWWNVPVVVLLLAAHAGAGEIVGTLKPANRVVSVSAVDRAAQKTFAADWDRERAKYRLQNLPEGTYDIILETDIGRIEGVNLKVEQPAPKVEPLKLEPSELDKGEITHITQYLSGLVTDRRKQELQVEGLVAHVRRTKLAEVYLTEGSGLNMRAVEVPLKDEERPQVSDMLLGLIAMVKVRDHLSRDFDLEINMPAGKPDRLLITPRTPELTERDRAWLTDWVNNLRIFENKKRVLDLDGAGDRARVLVEKLRDKPTSLPAEEPTAFWRVEIFDFRKYYGGWSKEKYTVVVRRRLPLREFRTYGWMFEKRLGGVRVTADAVTEVPVYEVPVKLDPVRGRVPF